MRGFSSIPKAELITEGTLAKKKKLNDTAIVRAYRKITEIPLYAYTGLSAIVLGMFAAFLQDIEAVGTFFVFLAVLFMGLSFVFAGINKNSDIKGSGSTASKRMVFVVAGLFLIGLAFLMTDQSYSGPAKRVFPKMLTAMYAIFVLKAVIWAFPDYFMKERRAEKCTASTVAKLTDIVNGSPCENIPASDSFSDYEYIYSYDGNDYLINTYEKNNLIAQMTFDIFLSVDPEKPENYYSPLFIHRKKLSDVIIGWLISLALAVFLGFLLVLICMSCRG